MSLRISLCCYLNFRKDKDPNKTHKCNSFMLNLVEQTLESLLLLEEALPQEQIE
jgi:hypothetical protein